MLALFALIALIFHWYEGVLPPLPGVAVKVTGIPAQTGFSDGDMETLTGNNGSTVTQMGFDKAGFPDGHCTLETSSQVTQSPFPGV